MYHFIYPSKDSYIYELNTNSEKNFGGDDNLVLKKDFDYNAGSSDEPVFSPALYSTVINSDGSSSTSSNNVGYGYYYDFSKFYGMESVSGDGIILPSYDPSVFELKNPNQNIRGIVR